MYLIFVANETNTPAETLANMTIGTSILFANYIGVRNTPADHTYASELHCLASQGLVTGVVEQADARSWNTYGSATLTELGREVAALITD